MKTHALILMMILYAATAFSEDVINGHYCYTYGDKESLTEARELTRTLAIRNAVESYKAFVNSTTIVTDSALTNDIIQVLASGYIKRVKSIEHTEKVRTICDSIVGYIEPAKFELALKKRIESRQRAVEEKGIDNNGILKILSAEFEVKISPMGISEKHINVVVKSFVATKNKINRNDNNLHYVGIDYFGENGQPINGDHKYALNVVPNQITTISFYPPVATKSFRVWLPNVENEKEDKPITADKAKPIRKNKI